MQMPSDMRPDPLLQVPETVRDAAPHAALLLATPGLVYACYPSLGALATRSRWAPVFWAAAIVLAAWGVAKHRPMAQSDHDPMFWLALTPAGQLVICRLAHDIFLKRLGRAPRNALYNRDASLFWDRVLCFAVAVVSTLPVLILVAPG